MIEEWRAVVGFEGIYEVSSLGRIRLLVRRYKGHCDPYNPPRLLKLSSVGKYIGARLHRNGKMRSTYVHRVVLEAFVGAQPQGQEASHIDGNPTNNVVSNLVWETRRQNHHRKYGHGTMLRGERHGAAKLTTEAVKEIRQSDLMGKELAALYGISRSVICGIRQRKIWKHVD